MNELDDIWLNMMEQAMGNAKMAGRNDLADYLALKMSNDRIRSTSCQWLFDSFLELSEEVNRRGIRLEIESENPHRFPVGNATMAGSLLKFCYGVRCLTIEAGWTRTPTDGFMRGGALAVARILHFGISKANADLLLLQNKELPEWFVVEKDGRRAQLRADDLRKHFQIFLGEV
jgi:hypothetical protein